MTTSSTDLAGAVTALLRSCGPASLERVAGGRNSQVYRVTVDRRRFALKAYFRHPSDPRDRLDAEFRAASFLWDNNVRNIPRPVAASPVHGFAVYDWIEGERLAASDIDAAHIDAATQFVTRLSELRRCAGSQTIGLASEANFSGHAVLENCRARLAPLLAVDHDPELRGFLDNELLPAAAQMEERIGHDPELPPDSRTLSPSDFGFHNSLQTVAGLYFLDFEYFGWDDPAKLVCDFLLHPAMPLSLERKRQFASAIVRDFSFCPALQRRVAAFYPLFGLKWCLILLNEFLPEHLLRRQFAGMNAGGRREKQLEQLAKARSLLRKTLAEYEHFPYFA